MKIQFPEYIGQKYYHSHYKFVLNLFKDCDVIFKDFNDELTGATNVFPLIIEGKRCWINYSDHGSTIHPPEEPTFKMHCKCEEKNIFPFTPISFTDCWDWYYKNHVNIEYKAEGYISNRQRAYAGAKKRREKVQILLKQRYKDDVKLGILSNQESYFNDVENILLSVCVPGANNNMLDRGQLQYMALGVCTISPRLPEILPFGKKLIPGIHYVKCEDDYSDLSGYIEYFKQNKELCIHIGQNAKQLFSETCIPERIIQYMKECLEI